MRNICEIILNLGHQFRRRCVLKKKFTGDAHRSMDYHKTSSLSTLCSGELKKGLKCKFYISEW